MPDFTKRAIKESFLKLLNEKPLSQISVRLIVEACGINRNSFYYHYQDIPALMEEIIHDEVDRLIARYQTIESLDDCMATVFSYLVDNRNAVMHIYHSVNRELYEQYLMKTCEYIVSTYLDTVFAGETVAQEDRETAILFFKCEVFGLSFDWIMNGMKSDAIAQARRITTVCRGLSDDLMQRIRIPQKDI